MRIDGGLPARHDARPSSEHRQVSNPACRHITLNLPGGLKANVQLQSLLTNGSLLQVRTGLGARTASAGNFRLMLRTQPCSLRRQPPDCPNLRRLPLAQRDLLTAPSLPLWILSGRHSLPSWTALLRIWRRCRFAQMLCFAMTQHLCLSCELEAVDNFETDRASGLRIA